MCRLPRVHTLGFLHRRFCRLRIVSRQSHITRHRFQCSKSVQKLCVTQNMPFFFLICSTNVLKTQSSRSSLHCHLPGMIWMHVGDSPDTLGHIMDWERQLEMRLHLAGFESGVLRDKGAGSRQDAAANVARRSYNFPEVCSYVRARHHNHFIPHNL